MGHGRLVAFAAGFVVAACGPSPPPAPPASPPVPLHLTPACDLVPAAGLSWLVEAKPRAIAQSVDLIPAIATIIPENRFETFTTTHGGVDPRQIEDLCVSHYKGVTLTIARTPIDSDKVIDVFERRSSRPPARTVLATNPAVTRVIGEVKDEKQGLIVFGREELALEQGSGGPLRAAEAFAFGKLRRAQPALRGAALSRAADVVGDAPLRAFAPGPFEGETAQGLGGLLRAATAVAISVVPVRGAARVAVRLVLTGAWGEDAPAAGERLAAAVHVLSESAIGKLFGLDRPLEGPRVRTAPEALILEATYDAEVLARGVHDAVDAEVADIMRR